MHTLAQREYSPLVRALDRLAGPMAPGPLHLDALLDTARRRTGLTDFGDDSYLEPLTLLLADIAEARASNLGRIAFRELLLQGLCARLYVTDALRRQPELPPVERPLFVVGLQRSGTSFTHELLAAGPGRRALRHWELLTVGQDTKSDWRRRSGPRLALLGQKIIAPEASLQRPLTVDSPDECWLLFHTALTVLNLPMHQDLPRYGAWLRELDWRPSYATYHQQLRLLLAERPAPQLVLKCPDHLWTLDALLDTFPDACVVWLHRDPVSAVASYTSMSAVNRRMFEGTVDPEEIGRGVAETFARGIDAAMAVRDARGDAAFFDLRYRDLVADPAAAVASLCTRFELPFERSAIDAYLSARPPGRRKRHRYTPQQFGLDPAALQERFAVYCERFVSDPEK